VRRRYAQQWGAVWTDGLWKVVVRSRTCGRGPALSGLVRRCPAL